MEASGPDPAAWRGAPTAGDGRGSCATAGVAGTAVAFGMDFFLGLLVFGVM